MMLQIIDAINSGGDTMGHSHMTIHPFNEPYSQLRPQCLTDAELDPSPMSYAEIPPSMEDEKHYVPGLNAFADVILAWWHAKRDMTHKSPQDALERGLSHIRQALDRLPPELRWRGGLSRPPEATWGHDAQMVQILVTSLYMKSNLLQRLGVASLTLTHRDIIK